MAQHNLFVQPPEIVASDYLPEAEARKLAGVRINSPPAAWPDEITRALLRDHPYIPADRIAVSFKKKDETNGYAYGFIGITGAPRISIPVIMRNRELKPMDVMIVRPEGKADTDVEQGTGDMTEDRVLPLTEDTFGHALDVGDVGTPMPANQVRGTGWTEDGSGLRLPYRGRAVVASVMGASATAKAELATLLSENKEAAAGFAIHGTAAVIDSWLAAGVPRGTLQSKLAAAPVQRATALLADALPTEAKTSEILAARVFVDDESSKIAVSFAGVDLAAPSAVARQFLVFEDGTYCAAPAKIAVFEINPALVEPVMSKLASASLHRGSTVSFVIDGTITAPLKLASIATNEGTGSIYLELSDGLRKFAAVMTRGVKTASFDADTQSWILPMSAQVLQFGDYAQVLPLTIDKTAAAIERLLPDCLTCSDGQFGLSVRGKSIASQVGEDKIAAVLGHWFENGDALLTEVKTTGYVRFTSDMPEAESKVAAAITNYLAYPAVAKQVVAKLAMPLDKAVKLAAAIGDPQGVDAVLGAGFLTEDNLSDFVGLADQFEDSVSKLARLLLGMRMGWPGDENATAVAMKSLQRVTEGLHSAVQEVG